MKNRGDGRIFQRKGSAFWWCAYYLRGKEYRESTGQSDEKKAMKFLDRKLKEVHADQIGAKQFVGPQQERIKVAELLDALEADYKLRGKESPQFKAHLKSVRDYFGEWRAVEVTAEVVDRFISELLEGDPEGGTSSKPPKSAATVNRSTQLLAQAYKLAIQRRRLSTAPVIRHLSERGNARQGFFSDAEYRSVLENLPTYLHDFTRFGYLTGWRKGEIASLRWEDVDGDVIRLRGENSKNGEGRTVTLDGELAELIERREVARHVKQGDTVMLATQVFHRDGFPVGDFRKTWETACCIAGLGQMLCRRCSEPARTGVPCQKCRGRKLEYNDLRYRGRLFHDFRRTAVRNMVRAGVPERVAMSVSGHKTRSIFDRYNIVSERDLRDAMQRTQAYLLATAEETKRQGIRQQPIRVQ